MRLALISLCLVLVAAVAPGQEQVRPRLPFDLDWNDPPAESVAKLKRAGGKMDVDLSSTRLLYFTGMQVGEIPCRYVLAAFTSDGLTSVTTAFATDEKGAADIPGAIRLKYGAPATVDPPRG